jgi:N-acyl-D-amino-acid deacylase
MKRSIDILIKDGLIFDGSGTEPFVSDIAISGDSIRSVGEIHESAAEMVIPAKGLAVAPGFIDTHAHSDFMLIADPRAEGKILQGVTTEINGNCGMSAAPLYGKALERREDDLNELGIRHRWNTVREYRTLIAQQGAAINIAMLAGHGNIRGAVVGYENRGPSDGEFLTMSNLLNDAVREGAMGLSTGLIYPPGIYSETDELIKLCRVLQPYGIIYTSHMRSEGAMLLEAIREVITIGKGSGVRVHVSHIKTAGMQNWHKADKAISMIMDARNDGLQITCDRYPYTASSTDLDSLLPSWAFEGGNEQELQRLIHEDTRARLRKELLDQTQGSGYWERVIVSSVASERNQWMEGKTIAQISSNINSDEIETVFNILVQERLRAGAIFMSMNEDNLRKFLSLPFCAIGSDSSARSFDGPTRLGRPHPRTFGTFPRFLGAYVRDAALMPMTEAVRRTTSLPAEIFGLKGRGRLKEGMFADITVFDSARISDKATFDDPFQGPEGIAYVLVNGIPAVWEGRPTGRLSGRMLVRQ